MIPPNYFAERLSPSMGLAFPAPTPASGMFNFLCGNQRGTRLFDFPRLLFWAD
jgi:hypothetical protein